MEVFSSQMTLAFCGLTNKLKFTRNVEMYKKGVFFYFNCKVPVDHNFSQSGTIFMIIQQPTNIAVIVERNETR